MTKPKLLILPILTLVLILASCGTTDTQKKPDMSSTSKAEMAGEMTEDEAIERYRELKDQEAEIFSNNTELWEKVFMAMDKNNAMTMIEDGKNYGDYLLDTIDAAKNDFSDDELKLIKEEAKKIREIESELTMLTNKYPEAAQKAMDSAMDRAMAQPSDDDMSQSTDMSAMEKFPSFKGMDLDGNEVDSDELFSENAVTVINFWFTTCGPCVGELGELDTLNNELTEKGGELIGVNAFTLDGDKTSISEAKDVLMKKSAAYRNVYFNSDSEAGRFTENIYAYPTTYVVDRSGNIVGEPIVGAITEPKQAEALKSLIDIAIAADMG